MVIWSNTEVLNAPTVIAVEEEHQDRNLSAVGTMELKVMSLEAVPLSRINHSRQERSHLMSLWLILLLLISS